MWIFDLREILTDYLWDRYNAVTFVITIGIPAPFLWALYGGNQGLKVALTLLLVVLWLSLAVYAGLEVLSNAITTTRAERRQRGERSERSERSFTMEPHLLRWFSSLLLLASSIIVSVSLPEDRQYPKPSLTSF